MGNYINEQMHKTLYKKTPEIKCFPSKLAYCIYLPVMQAYSLQYTSQRFD